MRARKGKNLVTSRRTGDIGSYGKLSDTKKKAKKNCRPAKSTKGGKFRPGSLQSNPVTEKSRINAGGFLRRKANHGERKKGCTGRHNFKHTVWGEEKKGGEVTFLYHMIGKNRIQRPKMIAVRKKGGGGEAPPG